MTADMTKHNSHGFYPRFCLGLQSLLYHNLYHRLQSLLCRSLYRLMALCLLLCNTAAARGFVVTGLPTQAQLPVGNVHCIMQDSEGYMWYGTRGGGICRDNGYQIDRLGGNNVICITEDRQGRIWFGSANGLCFIDKHTYRVTTTDYRGETSAVMCDSQGRLWTSVAGTVYCLDPDTGQKILEDCRPHENAASFYEDSQGRVWILFWRHKIWQYDGGDSIVPLASQIRVSPTRIVEDTSSGGYWIATWGSGVLYMDAATHALTAQPATASSLDQAQILDMKVDWKRGLVYTSTTDNLYIYRIDGRTLSPIDTSPFLPAGKKILDGMWIDRDDCLWVGGFIPTTFVVSPDFVPVRRYTLPQITRQTGYPLIADRCIQDGDRLWISQGRIGLVLYDKRTERLSLADYIKANSRLLAPKHGQRGVWCADGRTLLSLSADDRLRVSAQPVARLDTDIRTIRDQGNCLLIGTKRGLSLLQPDPPAGQPALQTVWHTDRPVIRVVADVDGQIFFLVENRGLYRRALDKNVQCVFSPACNITAMDISPDGTLWLGTEDGQVYKLPAGCNSPVVQDALRNPDRSAVIDIQVDALRHVWILTDQMVREVNPDNGNMRIFRNQDAKMQVSNFYKLECAGQKDMGIGAAGAYFEISPSTALNQTSNTHYEVRPVSCRLDDSLSIVPQGMDRITLPAQCSNLTLYVSVNRPLTADKIAFAYKLDGDGNWLYLPQGTNAVYLNNIPVGNCTLLLKSTDEYGRWSEHITQVPLYHEPYWWQTAWARLLFAALCAGVAVFLWNLNKRIHILSNLQKMRNRLSLREIEIKQGHESQAIKAEDTMKKIIGYIEDNMSDPDYNVQRLSEDMCMSRTNLYRRIHAVSGLSVIEFIRDIRLKHAALVLTKHPDTPIATVHKSVGFTSGSYFIKCFKKKFGVTPSEYAKQKPVSSSLEENPSAQNSSTLDENPSLPE